MEKKTESMNVSCFPLTCDLHCYCMMNMFRSFAVSTLVPSDQSEHSPKAKCLHSPLRALNPSNAPSEGRH